MQFAFTEQQLEFRDAVRQVLAKECGPADVRAAYDAPLARSRRWATLAELGVVGLSVPPDQGGLGLGLVDLVPLLEEAGRVALPEPLLETTALAGPLLTELEGNERWLEAISNGVVTAAVGTSGPGPGPGLAVAGADGADLYLLTTGGGDRAGRGPPARAGGRDRDAGPLPRPHPAAGDGAVGADGALPVGERGRGRPRPSGGPTTGRRWLPAPSCSD